MARTLLVRLTSPRPCLMIYSEPYYPSPRPNRIRLIRHCVATSTIQLAGAMAFVPLETMSRTPDGKVISTRLHANRPTARSILSASGCADRSSPCSVAADLNRERSRETWAEAVYKGDRTTARIPRRACWP